MNPKGQNMEVMPPTTRITAEGENGLIAHLEIVGSEVDPNLVKSAHNWMKENFTGDIVTITINNTKSLPNGWRLVNSMSKDWEDSWNALNDEE